MVTFAIGVGGAGRAAGAGAATFGYGWAALASGLVLLVAGAVAGGIAVVAKWLVVGRIPADRASAVVVVRLAQRGVGHLRRDGGRAVVRPRRQRHPGDEPVAARRSGAKIGRGVWCETYWLPEADLVTLGDGSTVNRGCVVQTHLFHDRIMRMDTVVLEDGATLGPHCVALPAARIGAGATVGPASLVMRGDEVPPSTRWQGNPIAPWHAFAQEARDDDRADRPEGTAA